MIRAVMYSDSQVLVRVEQYYYGEWQAVVEDDPNGREVGGGASPQAAIDDLLHQLSTRESSVSQ